MALQRNIRTIDTYHINLVNMNDIDTNLHDNNEGSNNVKNLFWYPILDIKNILINYCKYHKYNNILEIGPGTIPFSLANTFIGYDEHIKFNNSPANYINLDIDTEKISFDNDHFDFTYVRHVIEDIQSPDFALKEILRVSKSFYIETPSPLVEVCKGIDCCDPEYKFCGYIHHRYIIWSNMEQNTIYMLPKFGIIENLLGIDPSFMKKICYILNNYPVYWNTYFLYNKNDSHNIKIVMYKHGVNMNILKDYARLIYEAIYTSIHSTNYFIENYKKYLQ